MFFNYDILCIKKDQKGDVMKPIEEIYKFDTFIYHCYEIEEQRDKLKITYDFEIPGLANFRPSLELPKKEEKNITLFVKELVFHIGLVELISYWKCCCPKNILIECGYLNKEQIEWFKKLYFLGLGEFFYTNKLNVDRNTFVNIITTGDAQTYETDYVGSGVMIGVGGGKDSCVSLELLKNEEDKSCFIINPKQVMLACAKTSGLSDEEILKIKRTIDPTIIQLNVEGYLNGHTPFSAMVAFVSFLTAYLNDKKYIVLSNESSANESNVSGTKINHQYSKSYEFEFDFNEYTKKYFPIDIQYFSLLRPLNEYQIGMLLSKFSKYHSIFKSCNPGSKENPWVWCGHCAKCLFTFSMLSPFLYKEKLIDIFNEDLFEKKELLSTFQELLGYGNTKPFDCVGTYEEINYAISKTITNLEDKSLPFLLQYYKEHYPLADLSKKLETEFNKEHNLNPHFESIVKAAIFGDTENSTKTR